MNIGNPAEIRVLDLAQRIIRLTGSNSPILMRPLPVDDPPRRRPDITLAIKSLGWRPLNALEEVCFYGLNGFGLALFKRQALEEDAKRPIDGRYL